MTLTFSTDQSEKYQELWGKDLLEFKLKYGLEERNEFGGVVRGITDTFYMTVPLSQDEIILGPKLQDAGSITTIFLLCEQKDDLSAYEMNLVLLTSDKPTATVKEVLIDNILGTDPVDKFYSKYFLSIDYRKNEVVALQNVSTTPVAPNSKYSLRIEYQRGGKYGGI